MSIVEFENVYPLFLRVWKLATDLQANYGGFKTMIDHESCHITKCGIQKHSLI